jgi:hypothetical protein
VQPQLFTFPPVAVTRYRSPCWKSTPYQRAAASGPIPPGTSRRTRSASPLVDQSHQLLEALPRRVRRGAHVRSLSGSAPILSPPR